MGEFTLVDGLINLVHISSMPKCQVSSQDWVDETVSALGTLFIQGD